MNVLSVNYMKRSASNPALRFSLFGSIGDVKDLIPMSIFTAPGNEQ